MSLDCKVFIFALILITIKFVEDEYPSNKGIATIFNLDSKLLNQYEIKILQDLNYNLYLNGEDYELFLENHIKNIAE